MSNQVQSASPVPERAEPAVVQRADDPLRVVGALSLLLALAAIAWFFVLLVRDVEAAGFTRLETRALRLDVGPGWVDPRWEQWIAQRVAGLGELEADDPTTREALVGALTGLPFIAEVGTLRVLWPDGVRIDVRFREPVACVRTGAGYLTIAADGTLLPGLWSLPPARDTGFLPLLACDERGRAELADGAKVQGAALVDGLSVANALRAQLSPEDWFALGRIVIDARKARAASVDEPGTVLWLEGARRIYFGRSPDLDAPGELPLAAKCASISAALATLAPGERSFDWELTDVRWDKPESLPRGGLDDDGAHRARK